MNIVKFSLFILIVVFSNIVHSEDITAGKLVEICEIDARSCNAVLTGLAQGVLIGSRVGAIGTAKQIAGNQTDLIQKITAIGDRNTGAFLGFCQPATMVLPGYQKLFTDYVKKNPEDKNEIAGLVLILALQDSFPASKCLNNK
jgi:hypothetical protein